MASSRRTATNENISTGGNNTRDYDLTNGELSNWEQATDIDLVTASQSEVLECYDDAASFNDYDVLDGATTNSSYFRIIRPASGEGHDGTPTVGVTFTTTNYYLLIILENYSQIQDIIGKVTSNHVSPSYVFVVHTGNDAAFVGCMAVDSSNVGASYIIGFGVYNNPSSAYFINCLAHNIAALANGIRCDNSGSTVYAYNCTIDSCDYGIVRSLGTMYAKNCISSNNANSDWTGTITKTTCTDEGVTMTYDNAAGDDFHTSDTDVVDQGTDLSSDGSYAFDDDIDEETRSGTWDIGFDEYVVVAYSITVDAGAYVLTGTQVDLLRASKISIEAGSYVLTGTQTSLEKGFKILASEGSYTLTGTSAGLLRDLMISAGGGSFTLTGSVLNLLLGRKIVSDSGVYVLTGQSVGLTYSGGVAFTVRCYTLGEDSGIELIC